MAVRPDLVEFVDPAALAELRSEYVGGVVEQRHVAGGPPDLGDGLGPRPEERERLALVERAAGGELEQSLRSEQVVQQFGGGEHRPHAIERLARLGGAAEHILHIAGTDCGIVERCRER